MSRKTKLIIAAGIIALLIFVSLEAVAALILHKIMITPSERIMTEEDVTAEVTNYMKERYNEEFDIVNIISPGYDYACYIITAYPKGKPHEIEHKIEIQGWEKDGLIKYYDNYSLVKLVPEYREYIQEQASEIWPECKTFLYFESLEWNTYILPTDIALDEFMQEKYTGWRGLACINVNVPRNLKDKALNKKMKKTIESLAKAGVSGSIALRGVKEDKYNDIISYNCDYIKPYNGYRCTATISNDGKVDYNQED